MEATTAGEEAWTDHVLELGQGLLSNEVNSNVAGKQTRKIMRYGGSFPSFRQHCDGVVADGYRGITMV